jgi:DinB superfamily
VPVPPPTDYAPYYGRYVSLVPEADILPVLVSEAARTAEFLGRIPPAEEVVCHAPYTWTIRQVIGHLTDAERVFAYRALWFARGGAGPLPGFDDAQFAANAPHARVPLADQADEYRHLRRTSTCWANSMRSPGSGGASRAKPRSPSGPWRTAWSGTSGTT